MDIYTRTDDPGQTPEIIPLPPDTAPAFPQELPGIIPDPLQNLVSWAPPQRLVGLLHPQRQVHTLRIAVANTSDDIVDSGLFVSNLVPGNATTGGVVTDPVPTAPDTSVLDAKLASAAQLLAGHPAGTSVGNAPAAARTALQDAINAAQAVKDDAANKTQGEIDAAVTALQAAMDTFNAAVIGAGNPAVLTTKLTDAAQLLAAHPAGTPVPDCAARACKKR